MADGLCKSYPHKIKLIYNIILGSFCVVFVFMTCFGCVTNYIEGKKHNRNEQTI